MDYKTRKPLPTLIHTLGHAKANETSKSQHGCS
jgi:hypothetical protein